MTAPTTHSITIDHNIQEILVFFYQIYLVLLFLRE